MRAPAIAGRDDERLRAVLDRIGRAILMKALRGNDCRPSIVEHESPHEGAIVQHDLLRLHQLAKREIGRVARARRTHLAARVVHAAGAAPVQREAADRHRHGDDAGRLLILDVVVVPRMLAVVVRALAIAATVLRVENRSAGFDDSDVDAGPKLGELLGEHRGGDAAADDADVGFVDRHLSLFSYGVGPPPPPSRARRGKPPRASRTKRLRSPITPGPGGARGARRPCKLYPPAT